MNHDDECIHGLAPGTCSLCSKASVIWNRAIEPGKVFDLTLPLDHVADSYRAMDEHRAIKALLQR
jgi:hypothetical protein